MFSSFPAEKCVKCQQKFTATNPMPTKVPIWGVKEKLFIQANSLYLGNTASGGNQKWDP